MRDEMRDEIERWFCFASEASACCVEEGLRVNLGRGDIFWRAKRASVALSSSHARQNSKSGPRTEVQNLMLRRSRTTYKSDFVFFLTKRRQKKTREHFNSEYEKKRLPRRGWVLLKWPILVIFVKKKRVFFQFATYAARARARAREPRLEMEKKRIFFENWKN